MDFDNFSDIKKLAELDLANKDTVLPTCWAKTRTGKIVMLGFSFADIDEKQFKLLTIKRALQKLDATKYLLVSEVWNRSNHSVSPLVPHASEELLMFVQNDGNNEEATLWPIYRKEDGSGYITKPVVDVGDIEEIIAVAGMFDLFNLSDYNDQTFTSKRKIDKAVIKMLKQNSH